MGLCNSKPVSPIVKKPPSEKPQEKPQEKSQEKSKKDVLLDSLGLALLGSPEAEQSNGKDFYDFLFNVHPKLRRHFLGAEEIMNDANGNSSGSITKMGKQGQKLLMGIHVLASSFDTPSTFNAYVNELIKRHQYRDVDPDLWATFFTIFTNFLRTKGAVTPIEEESWRELGIKFNDAAQAKLKELGMPTYDG